eukprot:scaffold3264_cov20-Prasinocladus_malaysianus.AAC.2
MPMHEDGVTGGKQSQGTGGLWMVKQAGKKDVDTCLMCLVQQLAHDRARNTGGQGEAYSAVVT